MAGGRLSYALLAALAALWVAQFHPFSFPNNDFYSYRRAAWSLQAGEIPRSTKRGPILPAAIAAIAPAMPGKEPELGAALVVNLAFSLAGVLALARFAGATFPAAAPLFLVLLATTPVLHAAALQPLLEPSLGLFVALAFAGLRARSPWQYAAAGAAALSRPEALGLVAILAAANALAERRFARHLAFAALAALPCAVWYAIAHGGAGTYLALREAYGGSAPLQLAILPKELFFGWWGRAPVALAGIALAVGVPSAFGAWRAWRIAPREAAAMLAWGALSCGVVVLYGVGKARYVHAIAWVPLLGFAIGCVEISARVAAAVRRLPGPTQRGAVLAAVAGFAAWLTARAAARLGRADAALATGPDLAFAAFALLLLLAVCRPRGARPDAAAGAAALMAVALAAPVALGGVERKLALLSEVHDFDRAAAAAADWVRSELPPGERILALHRSQLEFASGLPTERFVPFGRYDVETLDALRAALERDGVRYVAYTWRRPPRTRAERFYAERRNQDLAAFFASGGRLPGFEHVATLPAPPRLHQPPAQIYRLGELAGGPVATGGGFEDDGARDHPWRRRGTERASKAEPAPARAAR